MPSEFAQTLENLLRGRHAGPRPQRQAPPAEPAADSLERRHREWFAKFAADEIMPRLTHTVDVLKRRGIAAHCRLTRQGDVTAAELVIEPAGLPQSAAPPRLTIAAASGERGLSIECTGTYPEAGAEGGFGAEVVYDTVYTSELDEQILEFIRMATAV